MKDISDLRDDLVNDDIDTIQQDLANGDLWYLYNLLMERYELLPKESIETEWNERFEDLP